MAAFCLSKYFYSLRRIPLLIVFYPSPSYRPFEEASLHHGCPNPLGVPLIPDLLVDIAGTAAMCCCPMVLSHSIMWVQNQPCSCPKSHKVHFEKGLSALVYGLPMEHELRVDITVFFLNPAHILFYPKITKSIVFSSIHCSSLQLFPNGSCLLVFTPSCSSHFPHYARVSLCEEAYRRRENMPCQD